MAWVGLERYGYLDDAQRLAYRFLYMCVPYVCHILPIRLLIFMHGVRMTTAFVDFNGVVPEKVGHLFLMDFGRADFRAQFDAVKLSHLVDAEYGNQGIDFKLIPREGFGWMNCESLSALSSCLP
jgi:alpha,alpha-trehalase